jgi:hypothetical protein
LGRCGKEKELLTLKNNSIIFLSIYQVACCRNTASLSRFNFRKFCDQLTARQLAIFSVIVARFTIKNINDREMPCGLIESGDYTSDSLAHVTLRDKLGRHSEIMRRHAARRKLSHSRPETAARESGLTAPTAVGSSALLGIGFVFTIKNTK